LHISTEIFIFGDDLMLLGAFYFAYFRCCNNLLYGISHQGFVETLGIANNKCINHLFFEILLLKVRKVSWDFHKRMTKTLYSVVWFRERQQFCSFMVYNILIF